MSEKTEQNLQRFEPLLEKAHQEINISNLFNSISKSNFKALHKQRMVLKDLRVQSEKVYKEISAEPLEEIRLYNARKNQITDFITQEETRLYEIETNYLNSENEKKVKIQQFAMSLDEGKNTVKKQGLKSKLENWLNFYK